MYAFNYQKYSSTASQRPRTLSRGLLHEAMSVGGMDLFLAIPTHDSAGMAYLYHLQFIGTPWRQIVHDRSRCFGTEDKSPPDGSF